MIMYTCVPYVEVLACAQAGNSTIHAQVYVFVCDTKRATVHTLVLRHSQHAAACWLPDNKCPVLFHLA